MSVIQSDSTQYLGDVSGIGLLFLLHRRAAQYPYRTPCGAWRYIVIIAEEEEKGKGLGKDKGEWDEIEGVAGKDLEVLCVYIYNRVV